MPTVERANSSSSIIDVLDRVLDKGIVIDAWVRLSLVGIDLLTVEARVVVASIDTYLKFSEAVGATSMVARPSSAAAAAPSTATPTGALAQPKVAAAEQALERELDRQLQADLAARPARPRPTGKSTGTLGTAGRAPKRGPPLAT